VSNKKAKTKSLGKRGLARLKVVQALYQMQMTDHSRSELLSQFRSHEEYQRIDKHYFIETLKSIFDNQNEIASGIQKFIDRPVDQLDPVEMGILMVGYYELQMKHDIDIPVIIDEAVNLAKCFGSIDGHKYINAILDKAAKHLR
jgi:N utilization substance protein B